MLTPQDFWSRIDRQSGPGHLILVCFDSWKRIADSTGMQGSDVACGLFVSICNLSTAAISLRSSLSLNLFSAYTREPDVVRSTIASLDRWLPAELCAPSAEMTVRGTPIVVERTSGMPGLSLYERAQAAVSLHGDQLSPSERYPALSIAWEEAVGRLGPL